jgi:uncharacterized protein with GYD domain
MPKYLIKASYTQKGAQGVLAGGGSARRDAVTRSVQAIGGTVEAFYFAFGDPDVYVISDLPDNESAVALALAVNSSDGASTETVVLLTPEEVDAASRKNVEFVPSGG